MVDDIEHIADLVGPEHVGIGTDEGGGNSSMCLPCSAAAMTWRASWRVAERGESGARTTPIHWAPSRTANRASSGLRRPQILTSKTRLQSPSGAGERRFTRGTEKR